MASTCNSWRSETYRFEFKRIAEQFGPSLQSRQLRNLVLQGLALMLSAVFGAFGASMAFGLKSLALT